MLRIWCSKIIKYRYNLVRACIVRYLPSIIQFVLSDAFFQLPPHHSCNTRVHSESGTIDERPAVRCVIRA